MTIPETLQVDDKVMKLLASMSVDRINRLICNTNQGALELEIRKGEKNYHFVLGAVPLKDDVSKELMGILFPVKALEVPTVNKYAEVVTQAEKRGKLIEKAKDKIFLNSAISSKKKLGRPKGSKDGVKNME